MGTTVWTEREAGTWTDCTYSAVLMCLVHAGFNDFPLGLNTVAERNALEASDDRPDGRGATFNDTDVAIARRYKVKMRRIADGSAAGLEKLLRTRGVALAVAGSNARLTAALRRWSPKFTGSHAVCVIANGDGTALWLDPLAVPGYPGERLGISTIMQWAYIPSDARYLHARELEDKATKETRGEKEERLAREVVALRKKHPDAAGIWARHTGMTQALDGHALSRLTRLSGEVVYLREYDRDR